MRVGNWCVEGEAVGLRGSGRGYGRNKTASGPLGQLRHETTNSRVPQLCGRQVSVPHGLSTCVASPAWPAAVQAVRGTALPPPSPWAARRRPAATATQCPSRPGARRPWWGLPARGSRRSPAGGTGHMGKWVQGAGDKVTRAWLRRSPPLLCPRTQAPTTATQSVPKPHTPHPGV